MKATSKSGVKAQPMWEDLPKAGMSGFCDHCGQHGKAVAFGPDGRQVCAPCYRWSLVEARETQVAHGHTDAPELGVAVRTGTQAPAHLRCGGDEEAAERLKTYVRDAADGLRRIIIAGLYIDYLISQLPHGHLIRWLATHCPEITERTVRRWRKVASKVLEHCDPKGERILDIRRDPASILTLPVEEVPEGMRDVRKAVDELIAGRSYRQLTFEFKQVEMDAEGNEKVKRGRRKGEGGYHPKQNPSPEEVASEGRSLAIEALFTLRTAIANVLASNYLIDMSVAEIESTQAEALRLTSHLRDVLPTVRRRESQLIAQQQAA